MASRRLTWFVCARSLVATGLLALGWAQAGCNQQGELEGRSVRVTGALGTAAAMALAHPEFDLNEPVDWHTFIGVEPGTIQDKMDLGFRLISLDVSSTSPLRFNASFVFNDGSYFKEGNAWDPELTEDELNALIEDNVDIRVVAIAPYYADGGRRYAAVWIANPAPRVTYKVALHRSRAEFEAAQAELSGGKPWRVIDMSADQKQVCVPFPVPLCIPLGGEWDVTGVMILSDGADARNQWFGYGPGALSCATPPCPDNIGQSMFLNRPARIADLDTPFGDGNFYYVVEQVLNVDTEYVWWAANMFFDSADTLYHPDSVAHQPPRFGARYGKLKRYDAGSSVRYLGVLYDNEVVPRSGAPATDPLEQAIDAAVAKEMKRSGVPAATLAVMRNGQLVHAKGYGRANLQTGRMAQPTDIMRMASVSKAITNSVIMRMVQDANVVLPNGSTLTLETHPFGEIFTDYERPPGTTDAACIDPLDPCGNTNLVKCTLGDLTVRHILEHSTGLDDSFNTLFQPFATPDKWVLNETIRRALFIGLPTFRHKPGCVGDTAPRVGGVQFYKNSGYQIMAHVIGDAAHVPYDQKRQAIFAPIDLAKILQPKPTDDFADATNVPTQAVLYERPYCHYRGNSEFDNLPLPPAPLPRGSDEIIDDQEHLSTGAMGASVVDMVRWIGALDGSRGPGRIINDDTFCAITANASPPIVAQGRYITWFDYPFLCSNAAPVTCTNSLFHGGHLPGEAQTQVLRRDDGIVYGFASTSDSLNCPSGDTHIFGTGGGANFENDLAFALNQIFDGLATPGTPQFADQDLFHVYRTGEPHAVCKPDTQLTFPADATCHAFVQAVDVDGGSTGFTGSLRLSAVAQQLVCTPTGPLHPPPKPLLPLHAGPHTVQLGASNGTATSTCTPTVTVVDVTAPNLVVPAPVTATVCFGNGLGGLVNIGQATATDNCADGLVPTGFVTIKDGFTLPTAIPVVNGQATLTPGAYVVQWSVSDGHNGQSKTQNVNVLADATVPVISAPANVSVKTCQAHAVVSVGQATATDNCPVTITGQVIASNGVTLPTPIPIVGGQVDLGVGTHTVRWTATDGFNTTPPVTRTATVAPVMEASLAFDVQDRGQVRAAAGGFAAVLNAGTGTTNVGQDGRTGALLSRGPVTIQHRAIVDGPVTSGGTVTRDADTTVNGTITTGASVTLPALPALPAFPPATGGSFTVNSGQRNQPPGSFTTVSVNGGTLVLASGDYFFQSLTMNSNGTVRATPTTRVFVRDSLGFQTPFRASSGTAVQPIFLGFAGSNLSLGIRFDGTLVAPNATVSLGSGSGVTYTGSFFGRTLRVNPGSALVCQP